MKVYRLCKKKYKDTAFTGEGSHLVAGRWHGKGTRMVYCSETPSLAALEVLVHLQQLPVLPYSLQCVEIDDKDVIDVQDWKLLHAVHENEIEQIVGDMFIVKKDYLALRVTSALSPVECNVLLNPAHIKIKNVEATAQAVDYTFDTRLWKEG